MQIGMRQISSETAEWFRAARNGGEGLRVVAGLIGHADIKTTFGYAHFAEDSVFDDANRVSRGVADMRDGGEAVR